jgi:hypothetical protein
MRGLLPVLVAALVGCVPAVAAAQTPNQDIVFGTAGFGDPRAGVTASVDARSGPTGEDATGTATFGARQTFFGGPVTCLNVTGNRAVIGGDSAFVGPAGYLFVVVDNSATGAADLFGMLFPTPAAAPTTCPSNLDVALQPAVSGDLVVHDASAFPTSKGQCKNGGWQDFGVFKNQGDCVSYVIHHARLACTFERVAHGVQAFRTKYGRGPYRLFAWERCLKSWILGEQP